MPFTKPEVVQRQLQVATAGLSNEQIAILSARVARDASAEAIRAGELPTNVIKTVNGRLGVSEESVVPPGPIVYTAQWWPEVVTYGLAFAMGRSPVRSGRFKHSWFAMANGAVTEDYAAIPLTAEVIITNDQPYARKIELGAMKMSLPPGVVQDTMTAVRRKFGDLLILRRAFIQLERGYVIRRTSGARRRSRAAGRPIAYPALVMRMRLFG